MCRRKRKKISWISVFIFEEAKEVKIWWNWGIQCGTSFARLWVMLKCQRYNLLHSITIKLPEKSCIGWKGFLSKHLHKRAIAKHCWSTYHDTLSWSCSHRPKDTERLGNEKLRQTNLLVTDLTKQPSDSWTDRLNDRQGMIERQTDGQASGQTDRRQTQTDMHAGKQTDRKRVVNHLVRCFRESVIQQADYYVNVNLWNTFMSLKRFW